MFYLVGLGLGDAEDITIKGLKIVQNAKRVYLEAYTSILTVGKEALVRWLSDNELSWEFDMGHFDVSHDASGHWSFTFRMASLAK